MLLRAEGAHLVADLGVSHVCVSAPRADQVPGDHAKGVDVGGAAQAAVAQQLRRRVLRRPALVRAHRARRVLHRQRQPKIAHLPAHA